DLVVAKLLIGKRPQAADHQVGEGAGRKGAVGLDQAHADPRIGTLDGAGRPGPAPAQQGGMRTRPPSQPKTAGGSSRAAPYPPRFHLLAAYHSAMACACASEKPLAIRPMTVLGRCPLLKACI